MSNANGAPTTYGWYFDPRGLTGGSAQDAITGGFDVPAKFTVIVDPIKMETYGTYDFGSGPIESTRYSFTAAKFADLTNLKIFQDWRSGSYTGILVDDLSQCENKILRTASA